MITKQDKNINRKKRQARVRGKISGTAERPRLNVYRSNAHIYAQVIDDISGKTIASASTLDKANQGGTKVEQAQKVGQAVAKAAKAAKIENVIFDRAGYLYHGRVKSLAEAAREEGLKF